MRKEKAKRHKRPAIASHFKSKEPLRAIDWTCRCGRHGAIAAKTGEEKIRAAISHNEQRNMSSTCALELTVRGSHD